ncbi:hypothetical protein [Chromobacterium sp. IIBBL 290-4]|uniref:hypothetical protein n=1 Tax=Chromobacterium sp. IIBBL 290-4 TaxID=2953890 RepID=UPI0020B8217D|nr:hypothetical protein [Chromobacterium sp. IIBBL 290-4]UTH73192.1 hypothetical protein NKT35_16870 [Chromobacterium sp. IIBBL 290-4]
MSNTDDSVRSLSAALEARYLPFLSGGKAGNALSNQAVRALQNWQATLGLLPVAHEAETWQSLVQLQFSAHQKLVEEYGNLLNSWAVWLQRFPQLQQANTLSKLAEQEVDLVMRAIQLQGNHWINLSDLLENFQVNYAYWAHLQLQPEGAAPAV